MVCEVFRRRGLKFNTGNSKMMILNGEKGLEYEVYVHMIRLEDVSEFKYLKSILKKLGIDGAQCSRKVVSGRRISDAIRSLVNARDFQIQYARVLHETLLVTILIYDSETVLWK